MFRLLLMPIAMWIPASLALGEPAPRACGDVVEVRFDTTVTRPGSDSIVQFTPIRGGPAYPAELRSVGDGSVVARFVVDTNGRVIKGSAMIVAESHRGFGQSVCRFLRQATLHSGAVNGRKLTVEVSAAPFAFHSGRPD